jgi:hypothetical protein
MSAGRHTAGRFARSLGIKPGPTNPAEEDQQDGRRTNPKGRSTMNKPNLCVVAVIGASLIGGASAAMADGADRALASRSKFQLANGEAVTVKPAAAGTKGYRICMEDTRHAVPLRVTYDGTELLVPPGECRVVGSTSVRLSSAERLRDGIMLVGRFTGRTTNEFDAGMRIAQIARED